MRDHKFIQGWERKREIGRKKYVIRYTIISTIGLPIGTILGRRMYGDPLKMQLGDTILACAVACVGGLLLGAVVSFLRWESNEDKYYLLTEENDERRP